MTYIELDFRILVGLEKAGNEFLPLGKKKIQRRQHPNPQADKGGADHGKAFRRILRHALGGDFAKDQNHDRHNDGGNRRAHVAVETDKQKRTDRRNQDIHDIVSNQDGRDQLVVISRQLERQRRSPVSVIRENLQPSLIQRRKCRFCRAEIGGHGNTDDHRQNTSHIIHTKLLDFLFIIISCKSRFSPPASAVRKRSFLCARAVLTSFSARQKSIPASHAAAKGADMPYMNRPDPCCCRRYCHIPRTFFLLAAVRSIWMARSLLYVYHSIFTV